MIGINETNPDHTLHLSSGTDPMIRIDRTGGWGWGVGVGASGNSGTTSYFMIEDITGGNVPFTIAYNTGYVGINTTTPSAHALNVVGDGNFTGNLTAENVTASYFFGDGSSLTGISTADVWVNESGDTMTGNLNMNSQGIWYAANGSMGIGTTSPTYRLHVNGSSGTSSR